MLLTMFAFGALSTLAMEGEKVMLLTMFAFGALSTLAMEGLLFYIHLIRLMKTVSIGIKETESNG